MVAKKKNDIENLKEKIIHNMDENMNKLTKNGQDFLKDSGNHNAVQELIEILIKNKKDDKNSGGGGIVVIKNKGRRIT